VLIPTKASIPFIARRKLGALLTVFSDSEQTLHLAGSYFFKVAKPDSDIDFYVAYSLEAIDLLEQNGFHQLGAKSPKYIGMHPMPERLRDLGEANNTFGVYEHATLPVHVQVFHDLPLALATRDLLAKAFNDAHTRTRGPSRSKMWQAAEKAAREILSLASPA
jgi:hypothetical protein